MLGTNTTATSSKRSICEDRGREKRKGTNHGQTEEDHKVAPFSKLGWYVYEPYCWIMKANTEYFPQYSSPLLFAVVFS
jgi:hypothetical protein